MPGSVYALALTEFHVEVAGDFCIIALSRKQIAFLRMSDANSFFAHLKSPEKRQLLKNHLLNVSAITSRLAAKSGMRRIGALIGLARDLGKYSTAFQRYLSRVASVTA